MAAHAGLTQGRWFTLSLSEQLGNLGSEFERALSWKRKNHPGYFEKAFDRTLELADLTLADARWRGRRLREIARLRDQICELLMSPAPDPVSAEGLSKYFLAFAVLARKGR